VNVYQDMLREYMSITGVNQNELAKRLGVRPPTVSNWLSAGHGITAKNQARIEKLCAAAVSIKRETRRELENDLILWFLDLPENMEQRGRLLMDAAGRKGAK